MGKDSATEVNDEGGQAFVCLVCLLTSPGKLKNMFNVHAESCSWCFYLFIHVLPLSLILPPVPSSPTPSTPAPH